MLISEPNLDISLIIALQQLPNIGNSTVKGMVDYYMQGGYQKPIANSADLFAFIHHCSKRNLFKRLHGLSVYQIEMTHIVNGVEDMLERSKCMGISAISYLDKCFPKQLMQTVDDRGRMNVPVVLFYKGDLGAAELPGVAVIGTRYPTCEGIRAGVFCGEELANAGFNVVSGLAKGCDTAGHTGALKVTGGKTTAFLAHGLDIVYPMENEPLAERIVSDGGLLMSEYPIGTRLAVHRLLERDRLQVSMAKATVVVQTGETGGTFHASRITLRARKPLFCLHYNRCSDLNKIAGLDILVKEGGTYVNSSDFIGKVTSSIQKDETRQKMVVPLHFKF